MSVPNLAVSNNLVIEKNVPVPEVRGIKKTYFWPFEQLQPGDSIFLRPQNGETLERVRSRIVHAANQYSKKLAKNTGANWEYTSRKYPDGIRFWRTA